MQTQTATVLNTLQKVQRFMDTNAHTLGTINTSGYRRILDDVVDTLANHAANQSASQRIGSAETAKQRVLRNALRLNAMRPIAAVAAAQLKQVPEFLALKMPPGNSTSARLIASARAMAAAATPYEKTFVDAGLAADFLDGLNAAAGALNTSLTNRGSTSGNQVGATQGLKAESARGREAVKVLDSLIEPQLAGDSVLLVQWKSARKFGGKSTVVANTTIDAAAKGPSGTVIPPVATPPADTPPADTPPADTPPAA